MPKKKLNCLNIQGVLCKANSRVKTTFFGASECSNKWRKSVQLETLLKVKEKRKVLEKTTKDTLLELRQREEVSGAEKGTNLSCLFTEKTAR